MRKNGRRKAGRPKKPGRVMKLVAIQPSIWTALEQVAIARSNRVRERLTRPDVLEAILLANPEVSREVKRLAFGLPVTEEVKS